MVEMCHSTQETLNHIIEDATTTPEYIPAFQPSIQDAELMGVPN